MIGQLVDTAALVADLAATNKDAALKELLSVAQAAGAFGTKATKGLHKRLVEREAVGSTGLGNGVAVPHVKGDEIEKVVLVLARAKKGLEWHAIDGRAVNILFLLASPKDDPDMHLQCLRWIATLARSADFRRFFLDARDDRAMRDLLREMAPKV
ncbi:MAG: PTS sugar transporter subunit IIA [Planctomycetes bacterium]|nr:PTS sugar transporter subunit IIA [Planctomycetota bacterium]